MSIALPVFTPMEQTLFLTLCGRALDNHLPHPILGDPMAEELVHRLGHDCARFRLSASPIINIALRARKLDQVARGFIDRHPNAVGLDLGAGLDTRMDRLNPPAGVDWYDIDFPAVITARQRLLPARANAHVIGADLTDPSWLDAVPTGRPAVIVADGLMAFLTQDDMVTLLHRLVGHFPRGEVAFNGYSRSAIWAARHYHGTQSVAGLIRSPGFDDPGSPSAGTRGCSWSRRSCSPGSPRWPSSRRRFAGSPAWPPTAPRCPDEAPPSCTTASDPSARPAGRRLVVPAGKESPRWSRTNASRC
jgi:O-methyltransferase involved in polyketide biosynthesis